MMIYSYIKIVLHILFSTNFSKTVYLNFKMLPFKQAVRLPIFVYGRMIFRKMEGNILIKNKIKTGMIKIGKRNCYVETTLPQSIWTICGTIVFNGPIDFLQGSYVLVAGKALLEFGTRSTICGSNVRIMCFEKIQIGNTVRIAWDVQIMDTSFHYVKMGGAEPCKLTAPVKIGDFVWVGNRTTISKGAIIPDWTTVASNSLVNKDFHDIGACCLLAGQPAKIKAEGFKRVYDEEEQRQLDLKLGYVRTHL